MKKTISLTIAVRNLPSVTRVVASLVVPSEYWFLLVDALVICRRTLNWTAVKAVENQARKICMEAQVDTVDQQAQWETGAGCVIFATPGGLEISVSPHQDDDSKMELFVSYESNSRYVVAQMMAAYLANLSHDEFRKQVPDATRMFSELVSSQSESESEGAIS